ncbi:MAG: hypothetical protein HY900_11630 [Deltaproteobacteria bacterium]|nr:hypothetical protein [Deltaproteobacteria bacterium]
MSTRPCRTALLLFVLTAVLAWGASARAATTPAPREAARELARLGEEAQRRSLLALDPEDLLPRLENAVSPDRAGWAYRNPLTAALALAAGGVEALYQAGLEKLAQEDLEESAYYLARVRSLQPQHRRARDGAFWLGEIRRREGRTDEAMAFFRLVSGEHAREASYRLARLLDARGRAEDARDVWK